MYGEWKIAQEKKKLFIHIGAHKTGSTALQQHLDANREALAEAGVLYPEAAFYHFAQHRIAFAMRDRLDRDRGDIPDFDEALAELLDEIDASDCGTVLISSEVLFSCSPDSIAELEKRLTDFDTTIIAYTRRQDDLFLSQYNQLCKQPLNGYSVSHRDYLDEPTRLHIDLDLKGCIDNWAAAFGKDAVIVRLYEETPNIETDICEVVGIPADSLRKLPGRPNRSITLEALEVIRLLKVTTEDPATLRELCRTAVRHFRDGTHIRHLMSSAERRQILGFFEQSNQDLFSTYLFRNNSYSVDTIKGEDTGKTLQMGDIVSLLVQVHEDFRKLNRQQRKAQSAK